MTQLLKPDICVIGAGSGGLTVAAGAAAFGVSVVLVEKGRMGGDCLNYGCVPSKALIAAARRAHDIREASSFGISQLEPQVDFRRVNRHVHDVIAAIAPNDSVERFTALGVRVIEAEGRFKDRRTLIAGGVEIRARRFVIATGSSPRVPDIPGLDAVPFFTNETIFDLTRRPAHLIIIGGGPIGMELAQAHRRLDSEVTVIEAERVLAREDPEQAAHVVSGLRREGVNLLEETKVVRVEPRGRNGVRMLTARPDGTERVVDGSHLLVAVGREPNIGGLGLADAGVKHGPRGIGVDDRLRTSNRRIYAVGDVVGGPQFTHLAGYHGGLVLRSLLFRLRAQLDASIVPRATFTDPEIASVGLSEKEAVKRHKRVGVLRWPYAENDRAQAERRTEGFIKVLAGKGGRILGVSIVGHNAAEMINIWALAVSKGLTLRDMTAYVAPYPTMTEIGKRAALSYFSPQARRPLVRGIVRFLRMFG